MRIAILTQPLRFNYGGILQNFALQTVLRRMQHNVVTLDPKRYLYPRWKSPFVILRHTAAKFIKGCREVRIFEEYKNDKVSRKLGRNTFPFIDKYVKRQEFANLVNDIKQGDYDAFIVGSDQVWRPEYNTNLPNMFLDFTSGWNVRRIAYAASFGLDTWSANEKMAKSCREGIRHFDFVSMREKSGVELCWNLFEINAQQVLDPTLLLTKEDYIKILSLDKVKTSNGDLLVYLLDDNDAKQKLVEEMSCKNHYTPYRVNSEYENREAPLSCRVQPPIEIWLRGFYDAKYIITDSFHGCVFSIIFQKQFAVYANIERGQSRFTSLFQLLEIPERFVCNIADTMRLPIIDFNRVNRRLEVLRKYSIDFLSKSLSDS